MINFYEQKLEVGETRLTDFNEGSEIRNLLEAFAILGYAILEEQYESTRISFISTSYGDWLDRIGELPFINLPRDTGAVASGNLTFTINSVLEDDYVIPADTLVTSSESNLDYVTLIDGTILSGETSVTVPAECVTSGYDGNANSDIINIITDDEIDTEFVSVNNDTPFEFGLDYEDDESYRERLLYNVQADGFGSMGYYKSLGESVEGVHDVKLVSDGNHTRKVLVNGIVKETPSTVLLDVLSVYSDLNNIVLGHSFNVDKPIYDSVDLEITLNVTAEVDEDKLLNHITGFFNGVNYDRANYQGLNIDEVLNREKLVSIFNPVYEIINVESIIYNNEEMSSITPSLNGVLKLGNVDFIQNVVN